MRSSSQDAEMAVPSYKDLMNPTLHAIRKAGGSASIGEIAELVIQEQDLSESVTSELHRDGPQTKLEHRLGWARTYLKRQGLIANSARGVWTLTSLGVDTPTVDPDDVAREVRRADKHLRDRSDRPDGGDDQKSWQEQLIELLLEMSPGDFEHLCGRLLRESGFVEVTVTGRAGDGGIDGHGIIRMGGFISFPVLFQCKRVRGSVSTSLVRDFRGAMDGRSDKGLFITTGNFTREARREATRDGAKPIDLIDGSSLAEKLKELELGVKTKTEVVEEVSIDQDFFEGIRAATFSSTSKPTSRTV